MNTNIRELSKDLDHKLTSLEVEAEQQLALCIGCGSLHDVEWRDGYHADFGKCLHCGDDTAFSGQVSLEWIKKILESLRRLGADA